MTKIVVDGKEVEMYVKVGDKVITGKYSGTEIEVDGRRVTLVDTAGLRRRSKVAGSVDHYAQLRSERAIERADVAIIVCDAHEILGEGFGTYDPTGL